MVVDHITFIQSLMYMCSGLNIQEGYRPQILAEQGNSSNPFMIDVKNPLK